MLRAEPVCLFPQDPNAKSKKTGPRRQYDPSLLKPIEPRGYWRNRAAYMQAMITFSVGTMNIWRFPWLMHQYAGGGGAGAFVIVYVFMMILVGLPVSYMETALGQIAANGPVKMWDLAPIGRGIGWSMFIVCIYIAIYAIMLAPWAILYSFYVLRKTIGWDDCINLYPSQNHTCIPRLCWDKKVQPQLIPSESLFYEKVIWLKFNGIVDGLGSMHWASFGFLTVAWILVYLAICRSVRSIGRVLLIGAVLPLILVMFLFMTTLLLDGAWNGFITFFTPVGKDFINPQLWRQAAEQALFSLGLGYGLAIAMGSYINFRNPLQQDTLELWETALAMSIIAGLIFFEFVGVLNYELQAEYDIVVYTGPGAPWAVYPEIVQRIELQHLWAIILFIGIFLITVAIEILIVETISTVVFDQFPRLRSHRLVFNGIICIAGLLLCLAFCTRGGIYILHVFDVMPASMPLLPIVAFEIFVVVYIYDIGKFSEDIYYMMKVSTWTFHLIMWRALPFILMLIVIITWPFHKRPVLLDWTCPIDTYAVAWVLIVVALLPIPGYAIWWAYHCNKEEKLDRVFAPHPAWTKRFKQNLE